MIIAFIACICWSIAIFPVTEAIARIGHQPVNFFRHFIAFFVLGIFIFILQPNFIAHLTSLNFINVVIIFASGILGLIISDLLRLRALQKLDIKTVSVFSSCQPAIGLIFGCFFLNENQNIIGICGVVITCMGLLLFTFFSYTSSKNKIDYKEIILLLICMLAQGISLVFSKIGLTNTFNILKPYELAYIRIIGAVSCMLLIALANKKLISWLNDLIRNKNNANKYFFVSTFLGNIIAVSCSLYALSVLPSVLAQSIFSLAPFFILPLNSIVKKEKMSAKQIMAFLISIIGVYLILWQKQLLLL